MYCGINNIVMDPITTDIDIYHKDKRL